MMTVQCPICVHLKDGRGRPTCKAFPRGIPEDILVGKHDHRKKYVGDRGIRYQEKATGGK